MPTVQSSPEVVREIKAHINGTTKELSNAVAKINTALRSSSEWNDAQGEQYRELMRKIARLIQPPIDALQSAQPKLEKLALSLDSYNKVKF